MCKSKFKEVEKLPELKTLPMQEVMKRMRKMGMHISPAKLKAGMDCGIFGFGQIVKIPGRKNCSVVILEADFERWVAEKTRKA